MRTRLGLASLSLTALALAGCGMHGPAPAAGVPAHEDRPTTAPGGLPRASRPAQLGTKGVLHSSKYPGVIITLDSLTRSVGGLLTARWTITNHGEESFSYQELADMTAPGSLVNFTGITISDHSAMQRYYPLSAEDDDDCLCYSTDGDLEPGHHQDVFTMYRTPPPRSSRVDLHVQHFGTLNNVKVEPR